MSIVLADWTQEPAQEKDLLELLGLLAMRKPELHQSGVEDWWRCKRYFALRDRLGLRFKGTAPARAPWLGNLYHSYAQDYYLGRDVQYTEARLLKQTEETRSELEAQEDKDGMPESSRNSQTFYEQSVRDIQLAKAMILVFIATYPFDPTATEVVLVEQKLTATIPGVPVPITGTIDLMLRDRASGEVWLVDHKTSSRNLLHRAESFSFEIQPAIYKILGEQYLKSVGIPPRCLVGFVHNCLKVPGIQFGRDDRDCTEVEHTLTRGPRKGEVEIRREYEGVPRFENFLKRVTDWYKSEGRYASGSDTRTSDPTLLQSWVRFDTGGIAPDDRAILAEVGRAYKVVPDPIRFYRQRTGCLAYQQRCPFLDLCKSHCRLWPLIVKEKYVQNLDGEHP